MPFLYIQQDNDPPNYNPFRKAHSLGAYEYDLRTLHRAQPLEPSAVPDEIQPDEEVHEDEHEATDGAMSGAMAASEKILERRDEEQGLPIPPRAFASWKSWSRQKLSQVWRRIVLASGSRRSGDVKRTVAGVGMAVIRHAPLGTKGAPFFQVPRRRSRFTVIEYAKQDGDITKNTQEPADIHFPTTTAQRATTGVKTGVPLLRFYEKRSPRDDDRDILDENQTKSDVESLRAELLEHLSSVGKPFLS